MKYALGFSGGSETYATQSPYETDVSEHSFDGSAELAEVLASTGRRWPQDKPGLQNTVWFDGVAVTVNEGTTPLPTIVGRTLPQFWDEAVSSILMTKLYVPLAKSNLVPRPRLVERLNEGMERKLTLVSAPAGFGKTTLLSAWIHYAGDRSCACSSIAWVSLDEGDNNPNLFWRYLVTALSVLKPDDGETVLLPFDLSQSLPEDILVTLINKIITDIQGDFALVLDDYHVITAQPIHDALIFLLDHLPPQMHLVIATRSDPPFPLAELRARGQLTELRASDLRFTADEATTFLNQVTGLDLSGEAVAALEARTEGWIAGLQLASLSMRDKEDRQEFIQTFTGSHRYILDYLDEQVLHQQSPDIQTFLLETSVLDRLSGPVCNAVTGRDDGQAVLERLEAANLFIVPLDDERRWYRYHHLFAELLRYQLGNTLMHQVPRLHRRAAEWYERNGLIEEAVQHALEAKDFDLATRLIERLTYKLWECGEVRTLLNWMRALPEEVVRPRPRLCLGYAWASAISGQLDAVEPLLQPVEAYLQGTQSFLPELSPPDSASASPSASLPHPQDALAKGVLRVDGDGSSRRTRLDSHGAGTRTIHSFGFASTSTGRLWRGRREPQDRKEEWRYTIQGLLADVDALQAFVARFYGDIPDAIAFSRRALERVPTTELHMRGVALLLHGHAHLLDDNAEVANQALIEAGAAAQTAGKVAAYLSAINYLAQLRVLQGQLREAMVIYRQAAQFVAEQKEPVLAGIERLGMGDLLREWNELEAASQYIQDGLQLAESGGNFVFMRDGYLARARLEHAKGNLDEALAFVRKAGQIVRRSRPSWDMALVEAWRTRLWIAQGDLAAAEYWAQRCGLSVDDELCFLQEFGHMTLTRVLLARGKPDEARQLLERLLQAAESAGRMGRVVEMLVLQTLVRRTYGDAAGALAALKRALALAELEGYARVFLDEGAPVAELLLWGVERKAWSEPRLAAYVSKLLSCFGLQTPDLEEQAARASADPCSHSPIEKPVDPLSPRELEVLQLVATGASDREIAQKLVVTVSTIKTHLRNIYSKLHVGNRTQAVARARLLHLLLY